VSCDIGIACNDVDSDADDGILFLHYLEGMVFYLNSPFAVFSYVLSWLVIIFLTLESIAIMCELQSFKFGCATIWMSIVAESFCFLRGQIKRWFSIPKLLKIRRCRF